MRKLFFWAVGVAFLFSVLGSVSVFAHESVPVELKNVGLSEKIGHSIPLDLVFTNSQGELVRLGQYIGTGVPTILNLVYFDCPMLCGFNLTGLSEGLAGVQLPMGTRFNVVTVSFDSRDTTPLAAAYKEKYVAMSKRKDATNNWTFLTGSATSIQALTDAVGFRYAYDPKTKEFAHTSVLIFISNKGQITRYLPGIQFDPFDMKMAILEAAGGKKGSIVERGLLFCYHYDPVARKYAVYSYRLMRIAGALTILALGVTILVLLKRERKGRR